MDIFGIAVFCIAAVMLLKLLGSVNPDVRTAAALLAAAVVGVKALGGISELTAAAGELFAQTGLSGEYIAVVFKSLGISFITQITCDCCRDNGENALASQLELAGRAALLLTALPMFTAAAEVIRSLLVF